MRFWFVYLLNILVLYLLLPNFLSLSMEDLKCSTANELQKYNASIKDSFTFIYQ